MEPAESPVAQHLNTNYVPVPSEVKTIIGYIDEQQLALDAIDAQIAELQRRRNLYAETITKHRDLLTPARQINSDILSAIFRTLVTIHDQEQDAYTHPTHPSVVVSHVCRRWRDLALGNPLLWTNINVDVPQYPVLPFKDAASDPSKVPEWKRRLRRSARRAEVFARRAKECSICVSCDVPDGPLDALMNRDLFGDAGALGFALEPINAVLAVTTRWENLDMRLRLGSYKSPFFAFLKVIPRISSNLNHLSLSFAGISPDDAEDMWKKTFPDRGALDLYGAPLRSFDAFMAYSDLCRAQPDWGALTTLSVGTYAEDGFGVQEAANVLTVTRNIVDCTIQFSEGLRTDRFPLQTNIISLPKLKSLFLRGVEPPIEFTAILDLPSLSRLSVHADFNRPPKDEARSPVVELIRRYGEQLVDVSFFYPAVTPSALQFILEKLPNVESLGLLVDHPISYKHHAYPTAEDSKRPDGHTDLTIELLEKLTPRIAGADAESTATCLCPNLRALECTFGVLDEASGQDQTTKQHAVKLIAGRRQGTKGVAWLNTARVGFRFGLVKELMNDLRLEGVETDGVKFTAQFRKPYKEPSVTRSGNTITMNVPVTLTVESLW